MPFTYSGDPLASDLDAVRFTVGDTDSTDPLLQDAEIAYLLVNRSVTTASIEACRILSRKFARLPGSRSIGEVSISYGDLSKRYADLANQISTTAAASYATSPYLSGGATSTEPLEFSEATEQWENHQVTGGYTPAPDLTER